MPRDERYRSWAMAPRSFEVVARRPGAPGQITLYLDPVRNGVRQGGPFAAALPGQYWLLDAGGGVPIPVVGTESPDGSLKVTTVRTPCGPPPAEVGRRVALRGPFGRGWDLEIAVGRTLLLIAWEARLGPLAPVADEVTATPQRYDGVQLWVGGRSGRGVPDYEDRARWALRGARVTITYGSDVRMTDAARQLSYAPDSSVALLTGPPARMYEAARALASRGVPADRIQLSAHRLIRCADGGCGGCRIMGADTPLFACRNGPVIGYDLLSAR